jgi:nitrogen fixation protein FixH
MSMTNVNMVAGARAQERSPRTLTGRKVFAILVAFFGVIASVNGVMIYLALTTFRGEETAHAYESGLVYNREIAKARDQAARGWRVEASATRQRSGEAHLSIFVKDVSGQEVSGVAFSATFAAPADKKKDVSFDLSETASGHYEGAAQVDGGGRDLILTAKRGDREIFRSKNRIRFE